MARNGGAFTEKFIYRGGKKLRCGYTTGSCAAGAAAAAAEMLLGGYEVHSVPTALPSGDMLTLGICDISISGGRVSCAVVKDSGDDPDITNGMKIYAEISRAESGITISGGEGIGRITRAGLDQPVGEYAINSVPRRMIAENVMQIARKFGYSGGFDIVVSAPEGTDIAKKTFNPRMGIVGGISIIGTTGIVEPMSNSALVDTIRAEANIRRSEGQDTLILTVGNYSEEFVGKEYPQLKERCVMCSNFIGEAADIGVSLGFGKILLFGHLGKLVKLGSGIMNTHSAYADGRMETLIACGALAGVRKEVLEEISACAATDEALRILLEDEHGRDALGILTERVQRYLSLRAGEDMLIGAVMYSDKNGMILKTCGAEKILEEM